MALLLIFIKNIFPQNQCVNLMKCPLLKAVQSSGWAYCVHLSGVQSQTWIHSAQSRAVCRSQPGPHFLPVFSPASHETNGSNKDKTIQKQHLYRPLNSVVYQTLKGNLQ